MDKKNKIGMEKRLGYAPGSTSTILIYYTVFLVDEKGQRNEALFSLLVVEIMIIKMVSSPGAAILFLIWLGA